MRRTRSGSFMLENTRPTETITEEMIAYALKLKYVSSVAADVESTSTCSTLILARFAAACSAVLATSAFDAAGLSAAVEAAKDIQREASAEDSAAAIVPAPYTTLSLGSFLPARDGLSAAREILSLDPHARVVFLTTFADDEYIVGALKLGARGYLIKTDVATIGPALAQVMSGKRVLEGKAIDTVNFSGHTGKAERPDARPHAFAQLTDREYEVVKLIAQGLDNKEIAATAYMGEGTVRNHISTILTKLELKNRTQIAIAYLRS